MLYAVFGHAFANVIPAEPWRVRMTDEQPEVEESNDTENQRGGSNKGVPSHLRADPSRSEHAQALRPGFRNPSNKNSKAQRRKKKKRR